MDQVSSLTSVCPVVRIRVAPCKGNPDGVLEINKGDFDPKKHQLADGPQTSLDLTQAASEAPAAPIETAAPVRAPDAAELPAEAPKPAPGPFDGQ